jgi:hypothetical protein
MAIQYAYGFTRSEVTLTVELIELILGVLPCVYCVGWNKSAQDLSVDFRSEAQGTLLNNSVTLYSNASRHSYDNFSFTSSCKVCTYTLRPS